jgi:hypothetical protein
MDAQATTGHRQTGGRRARWLVLAVVVAVAILVLVIATRPTTVEGSGILSECYWGYPIVSIDGGDPYLPVAVWPDGLRYDHEGKAVVDASGQPVIHLGERVALKGSIVEVHGDPSPCFQTRNIKLTSIESLP